jgi:hypothetical protein
VIPGSAQLSAEDCGGGAFIYGDRKAPGLSALSLF